MTMNIKIGQYNGLWIAKCGNLECVNKSFAGAVLDLIELIAIQRGIECGIDFLDLGDLCISGNTLFCQELASFAEKTPKRGLNWSQVVVDLESYRNTKRLQNGR